MNRNGRKILRRLGALALASSMLASAWAASAAPIEAEAAAYTVRIDPNEVVQTDFLGIGVNVIPTALMEGTTRYGYTEAHWEMDKKRILTVKPKVARVWFQIDWMESVKGVYTWDSPEMLAFYKYLDAFKEAGTEIEFNMGWKIGSKAHEWFNIPGVDPWTSAPADLDAYAASTSAVLNELIRNRGYDNIKYLTFYNEPNGNWDFEAPGDQQAYYAEMVRKASERLAADGLRELVEIWGPEETGAPGWTNYMKDHADEHIDGYSFHVYGEAYEGLKGALKQRSDYVAPKPVHLTEFGWADDNASNWDAGFANSVVAVANGGVKSALVWQLNGVWSPDPFGGTNGVYTMWDSIVLGMEPRKTYYSAGLLNRYIPEHSDVLAVDTGSPDLRAAAFRTPSGEYAILLESKAGAPKDVTFDFGGVEIGKTFRKHAYTDDVVRTGNAILPPASASFEAGTSFRDPNVASGYGFAIYTTEPAQTQVEVSPLTPTVRSGDKLELHANVIDNAGGVEWSIVGENNGAINKNTGVYHAPQVENETLIAVKATSVRDPSAYGIVLVKVLPKSLPNTVETPTFSLAPGVYPSAEAVALTTGTPGADIRYTLDGSEPTTSSPKYERPVILKDGTLALMKAKAFKEGLKPSGTVSALYQTNQVSNSPDGYEFCAYEGGECYFEGEAVVAFGGDGLFNYGVLTDGAACTAETFGGDPNPGAPKRCFVSFDIPDELPVVTFYNASFEKPATSTARPGPMTNGWDFNSRSGVQHNNGPFQATPAPLGVQTAYLKTDGGVSGVISQSINFKPGTYQMEFKAAKRTSFGGTQTFDVYFDDTVIGSYAPTSGEYVVFRTEPFETTGGRHTIKFVATTTQGDNTAFIDDVRIGLPKPAAAPHVANASFETPAAANDTGLRFGVTAGWAFNATSGVARNGNAWGTADAPLGVQAAALRAADGVDGTASQTVQFPAGTYLISFQAAKAPAGESPTIDVRVGGASVGTFSPAATTYAPYETEFFTVEEGAKDVTFVSVAGEGEKTALVDAVTIERIEIPAWPQPANAGFESPTITTSHGVLPSGGDGWTFNERSGMLRNGSAFGQADAPEGTQAALLQTNGGIAGEFGQTLVFPAGSYAIKFQAAKRTSFGGQQSFYVYLDDTILGAYTPTSGSYQPFTTDGFAIEKPGRHTIRFAATTTAGDNTAFIDAIEIREPGPQTSPALANAGFESPYVSSVRGNMTDGWTFNANAGIQRNGSAFGAAPAPEGEQTALIQNKDGAIGSFAQTAFFKKGTYAIRFQAARRGFGGQQTFEVRVGGEVVGTFAPATTAFQTYETASFVIPAGGSRTVQFVGTATTGDNTVFIDAVEVVLVE